jgi:DNA-binding transcriptional MerR regulator
MGPMMLMTLLAPRDVARRLGLSTSRVIQLDREGVLPALRDSAGRRLYDAEVVERFALERERARAAIGGA